MITAGQTPAPTGLVTGVGNFSHIVSDLDKSLEFYHDLLGLELNGAPRPFDANPAIMKMGNTPGAQSRFAALKVPGSQMGVEVIEYKDIDRKPAHPRFQDPGGACLNLLVRDLDTMLGRLKKANVHFVTPGGKPAVIESPGRKESVVFVQDPDGFFVEIAQLDPNLPTTATATSNIIGANLAVIVSDTAASVKIFQALGFSTKTMDAFEGNKLMNDTAGVPGGQFLRTSTPIPGTKVTTSLFEFKGVDRKPLNTRVQDPGTAILQLMVSDADAALKALKAAGATIVSQGGEAVALPNFARIGIARDPDNLYFELIQRQAGTQK
jgi:catechol 2,3-dioxygenase-like lactoylglutathione lyase family enzyme